ncbi:MAG: hypothetical protein HY074_06530, partial [Deltaproteobacteria bacterium]|nr:hypothetical protein [Deltaproteobacteria bacterium]
MMRKTLIFSVFTLGFATAWAGDCPPTSGLEGIGNFVTKITDAIAAVGRAAVAAYDKRPFDMPKLITGSFHAREQVCADARATNPDKKILLVAIKNHICDREAKGCLRTTRAFSDRCNRFLQEGFPLYHTRNYWLHRKDPPNTTAVDDTAGEDVMG